MQIFTRKGCLVLTAQIIVLSLLSSLVDLVEECRINYKYGDIKANCSDVGLQHIPYQLQHNIRTLDLSNNDLQVVYENAFAKYYMLTYLYLQNNGMTQLKEDAFAKLKDLKTLDLSSNELTVVPTSAFKELTSLLYLSLRGNRITRIENKAFANLSSLQFLHLDGNYIEFIAPRAFYGMNFLQSLDLQDNALTKIPQESLSYLTLRFRTIKLHNNPWLCDCRIAWLQGFLQNESRVPPLLWKSGGNEPKCNGPSLVKDKLFSDVDNSQFLCDIRLYSSKASKAVAYGQSANLRCRYYSDPFVPAQWSKDGDKILPDGEKYIFLKEEKSRTETVSVIRINKFQGSDVGTYTCKIENARSAQSVEFEVTLLGHDDSAMATSAVSEAQERPNPPNTRTIKIVLSVVGGILFLIALVALIIYGIVKCKRNRKKELEERSMTFKEHLKTNILNQNGITDSKTDLKSPGKELVEPSENSPLYDHVDRQQTDANTYVSFKSEFVDQEEVNPLYSTTNKARESDESNCESTSPLLENFSPILSDSYDPLCDSSIASSYYHTPRQKCNTLNSRYLPSDSSYDTYLSYMPYSTLSHTGQYSLPPHGIIPGAIPGKRSASATYLGPVPPKKPPRMFHSRDSMSLNSHGSENEGDHRLKLSLPRPKPGTVDQYGTAV